MSIDLRPGRLVAMACLALVACGATLHAQGTITGVVREDSTKRPLMGAEITVDSLPRMTLSDDAGRFTLRDLPTGAHNVHVRLLGYRASAIPVQLSAGVTTTIDAHLVHATVNLDTMAVIASERRAISKGFQGFEERRKQSLGRFVGTDKLRESDDRRVEDVLSEVGGLRIVSPPPCPSRGNRLLCEPNPAKRVATVAGCPVQIAIDGALIYRGRSGTIDWSSTFNLGDISVRSLAGIEVYRGESEVPSSLAAPGTTCGMIAFWSRRD
ncbi:MAG: hypothetical protein JWM95_1306 [Gemmatimonadetes bacterium]|nr:hypothetical protein [Gemmatimonadota bacterium]